MIEAAPTCKTCCCVGETIRYDLEGKLAPGVTTKDVFLHIAGAFGEHANQNVEFGGSGLKHLSLNARRTISTMGAEMSAEFATFEGDDLLLDYVRKRNPAPFAAQYPDTHAVYKHRRAIALDRMETLVALPVTVVNHSVAVANVAGDKIH